MERGGRKRRERTREGGGGREGKSCCSSLARSLSVGPGIKDAVICGGGGGGGGGGCWNSGCAGHMMACVRQPRIKDIQCKQNFAVTRLFFHPVI